MARSIEKRGHQVTFVNWNESSVSRLQLYE